MARILIFHGYLLAGTGSNVYNARLAQALARLGHDVHLLCQERHPQRLEFVDAAGDWDSGRLEVRRLRSPEGGSCTVYRPDIGGLLPVYVADRYEAMEARTFAELSDKELAHYLRANVEAVAEVAARAAPELALANHLVMGPVILARALKADTPYAVKVHGSALEYTVKPEPERFLGLAREGLAPARTVLVGSRHTAESLWEAIADPGLRRRTRLGPPGVDVARFRPRERPEAMREVAALAGALERAPETDPEAEQSAFASDPRQAGAALARVEEEDLLVAFVGKLIVSKGPDLLLAAFPLVLERLPRARLLVVGFGAFREGLERIAGALGAGDLERVRELARAGRALEGAAAAQPLTYLLEFLEGLRGPAAERYLLAARSLSERVLFTGRLEHEELDAAAARLQRDGGAEHLPRGLRDGGRRGGRLRGSARQRGPLGVGRGQPRAGRGSAGGDQAPAVLRARSRCRGGDRSTAAGVAAMRAGGAGAHARRSGGDGPRAVVVGERRGQRDGGRPRRTRGASRSLTAAHPAPAAPYGPTGRSDSLRPRQC